MNYVIDSMQQWGRVFTDPDYWRPMVEHIVQKHRLGSVQRLRAGYPGSNAVFWVNETFIVKIFGQPWQDGFERELEMYQYLSPHSDLLTPEIYAHGAVEAGQTWKYMVMEGLLGERLGDVWKDIPRDNQFELARQFGRIVKKLHSLPVDGIQTMDTSRSGWRRFVETQTAHCAAHHRANNSLPEHLLAQIPGYLEATPLYPEHFTPCIVNGDFTEDHELLSEKDSRWTITGLIDFGDVEIGHRDYEFAALYLGAFNCDPEIMHVFLDAYEYPDELDGRFNQRMMVYSLFRCLNFREIGFLKDRYSDIADAATLKELQEILWRV